MSPLHGEFELLLLACSDGCGLRTNILVSRASPSYAKSEKGSGK